MNRSIGTQDSFPLILDDARRPVRAAAVAILIVLISFPASVGCSRKPTDPKPEPAPLRILAIDVERAGRQLVDADLAQIASDQVLVLTCRLENAGAPRFEWRASGGTFSDAAAASGRWTAPHAGGPVTITVTVSNDSRSVVDTLAIVVNEVPVSLVAPADGAILDNGCVDHEDPLTWDFSWSPVATATNYEIIILTPAETSYWEQITTATAYQLSGSSSYVSQGGVWGWKVRARMGGAWTSWSAVRGFLVEPVNTDCAGQLAGPTLLAPRFCEILDNGCSGGADEIRWDFSWSPLTGADGYQLAITADGRPMTIDPSSLTTTSTQFVLPGGVVNGTYLGGSWTVRAHVGSVWTDWSRSAPFGIEPPDTDCPGPASPPELLLPETGAVMDNGCYPLADTTRWEFKWAPVSGATRYDIRVIHSDACFAIFEADNLTSTNGIMVRVGGFTYATSGWGWRARAMVGGVWSPWSATRNFNVEPPNTDCPGLGAVRAPGQEDARADDGFIEPAVRTREHMR